MQVPGLSIPRDNGHDETNTSWTRRDSIKSYSIGDDNLLQEGVTPHDFTSPTSSAPPVFRNESNAQDYSLTSDAYQPRPASSNIPQASNQESGPLFDVSPSENDTESGLEQLPQVEVGEEAKTRTGASIMGQTQIGYESEGSGTNSKRTEDISSLDQNLFPDLPSSSDEQSPRRRSRLQPHERGPAALEAHRNRSPLVPPGITPAFTFEQEPHLPEQVSAPASQPSRGHFAPVIPPGATPAPNLEQAPFLEHEPGASRTNKRVKTRPSNLDLATSGPSTATPSATNPNSVYNTPLTTGGLEAPPIPRPGNVPRSIPPMPTSAPQQFQPTFESNVVGDSVDARERSSHQPRPPPSPRIKPLEAIQRENMRPVGVQGPRDDPLNDLWPYDPDPQHAHVPPPKVSTTPPGDPPSPIPSDEEPFLGGGDCDEQQQQQQQPTGQQQTGQQQQPAAQSARASRPKRSKRVAGKIKDGAWKVGKPVALVGKAVWKFLRHGMERSPPAAVGGLYGPLTDLSNGDLFKRSK